MRWLVRPGPRVYPRSVTGVWMRLRQQDGLPMSEYETSGMGLCHVHEG